MNLKEYQALLVQRLELQQQLEPIQAAIDEMEAGVLKELQNGATVEGFKLKKGRKSRKAKEAALVQTFVDNGLPRKILYDAKLKGVPALATLIEEHFPSNHEEVYAKCISETTGKPSLEYIGVTHV